MIRHSAEKTSLTEKAFLPDGTVYVLKPSGPEAVSMREVLRRGPTVLFALPGAYTSVCSTKQVPEYATKAETFRNLGIRQILCLSVNDPYVMNAWAGGLGVLPQVITFLSDPDAVYTKAIGMDQHLEGLGVRSLRYSALIDRDGFIGILNVDERGGKTYKVSGPDNMLKLIEAVTKTGQALPE